MDRPIESAIVLAVLLILFAVSLSFYDDGKATAVAVLEADGVTSIETTGWAWFACSDSDTFSYGFEGVKHGRRVKGAVCSGLLKGSTIRYTAVR